MRLSHYAGLGAVRRLYGLPRRVIRNVFPMQLDTARQDGWLPQIWRYPFARPNLHRKFDRFVKNL